MTNILILITTAVAALASPPPSVQATPEAVTSSPSAPPALVPATGPSSLRATPGAVGLASWYGQRPVTCDGRPMPWWVKAWTAHLSLPCGTMVTVSGPAGSITVPVEDRGPEAWTGRVLDLSPGAFRAVVGNLWAGVVPVTWRAA